jgi:hypothetical protein
MASRSQGFNVETFLKEYKNDTLRKPRIQRKKRWNFEKSQKYILFLIRRRNGVIPFLVNERVVDGKKIYYIFDGNNRSNAILDFCLTPLTFMSDMIPALYSPEVVAELKGASLDELLKSSRYTYTKFCHNHKLAVPDPATIDEYETAWNTMMDELAELNFWKIDLPMTVFDNISEEDMCDIYQSTNSSGTPLSPQELLASSTNNIRFSVDDLRTFRDIEGHVNEYYGEMNTNEKLKVGTGVDVGLNLFEVLTGLQMWLHSLYPEFVPEPSNDKDNTLDVIFKVYEAIAGSFTAAAASVLDMNVFVDKLHAGCKLIDAVYGKWIYDREIGRNDIDNKRFKSLNKNNLLIFLVFLYMSERTYEQNLNELIRVALYHELMCELDKDEKGRFAGDIMEYKAGGRTIPDKVRKIRETRAFEHVPSVEEIRRLLGAVYTSMIAEGPVEKRKEVKRFKAIAFSAFFNYQIPSHKKSEPQNKDHIIPYSTRKWADAIDICRLGNMQLIAEKPNKTRGKKAITSAWIDEYNLHYEMYPSEEEYAAIVNKKEKKINAVAYVAMCERREALYLSLIMKLVTG